MILLKTLVDFTRDLLGDDVEFDSLKERLSCYGLYDTGKVTLDARKFTGTDERLISVLMSGLPDM